MMKAVIGAIAGLALAGVVGCSDERRADNIPRPVLNSERMNTDTSSGATGATSDATSETTVGSNPSGAMSAGGTTTTDATTLSQSAANRASPSPSASASAGAGHGGH